MHLNILALAECKKQDIYTGILPSVFFLLAAYLFIGNQSYTEKKICFFTLKMAVTLRHGPDQSREPWATSEASMWLQVSKYLGPLLLLSR